MSEDWDAKSLLHQNRVAMGMAKADALDDGLSHLISRFHLLQDRNPPLNVLNWLTQGLALCF